MKVNDNCIYKGKFQKRCLVWIDMHRQQTTETQEKQTVLIRCPTYSQKLKYVYDFATVVAPASDSIKFNSTTAVSNFFGTSATILNAPYIVFFGIGAFTASAIVDSILNASASAAVILRNSSSVVTAKISTTPWMIRLEAPA